MSITNTTTESSEYKLYMSVLSGGIELQERVGQSELVISSQLPRLIAGRRYANFSAQDIYERMGIKTLGESKGDDLFYDVELPKGWGFLPVNNGNGYWTELFDENNSRRGSIFYKAAFYDRKASMNISPRFELTFNSEESEVYILDHKTHKHIFQGPYSPDDHKTGDQRYYAAIAYMDENFPEWNDGLSYWNRDEPIELHVV